MGVAPNCVHGGKGHQSILANVRKWIVKNAENLLGRELTTGASVTGPCFEFISFAQFLDAAAEHVRRTAPRDSPQWIGFVENLGGWYSLDKPPLIEHAILRLRILRPLFLTAAAAPLEAQTEQSSANYFSLARPPTERYFQMDEWNSLTEEDHNSRKLGTRNHPYAK